MSPSQVTTENHRKDGKRRICENKNKKFVNIINTFFFNLFSAPFPMDSKTLQEIKLASLTHNWKGVFSVAEEDAPLL